MEKTNDNSNSSHTSDFDNSGSELDDNLETGENENGGNHFYFLMGDENYDLGDAIRQWESIRFGI
jgi:hypothetical protein